MENEKNLEEVRQEPVPAEEPAPVEETAEPAAEEMTAEPAAEEMTAEETAAEEASAEEAASEEEPAEETASEEAKPAEKKATPGKMALLIGAIVVAAAVIVALLAGGSKTEEPAADVQPTLDTTVLETQPEPTIPADGNPDDETCKGTYTVSDDEAKASADTVVATMGAHELTNAQLQTFYWMQIRNFLSSEYGSAMLNYGMLDYTMPLDMQVSPMENSRSWQQFFLKESLITWQNYCILSDKAKDAGMELPEDQQAYLDTFEESLTSMAEGYGLESLDALLSPVLGAGADVDDYRYFQEKLLYGNLYYDAEIAKLTAEPEELEAFFAEHESSYTESGITKDGGDFVNVRHVLFVPEGGTTDETGATVYSEEEWAACEMKSQEILNAWANGKDISEESFAALAAAYSQDPGSQANGGLYENVHQGQMVPEFDQWCFDDARKPGHYGRVKTTYGYHLMYFVSRTPIWQYYAKQDLLTEKSRAVMDNLTAGHSMDVDYSNIVLAAVNLAG